MRPYCWTFALALALAATSRPAQGQWRTWDLCEYDMEASQLVVDSTHDALYACGRMSVVSDTIGMVSLLLRYSSGTWDTVAVFAGTPFTAVIYHDTLIVGGYFTYVNNTAISHTAAFVNGEWIPYGNFEATVKRFRIINDELYAVGGFWEADGHVCKGVAKRVGSEWVNVGVPPLTAGGGYNMEEIIQFNGDLIVGGTFAVGNAQDLIRYDGTDWTALGPGLQGGISVCYDMVVYHNELIVAGAFTISSGNAGKAVMRWDGSAFHPLGLGVQVINGSYANNYWCHALAVHEDKLFVGGGFLYAGGVPAPVIASWDGENWCGFGGDLDGFASDIAFFHDTLFAGMPSATTINGEEVDGIAQFLSTNYADTCSVALAVTEVVPFPAPIVQSLGQGQYMVTGLPASTDAGRIIDVMGRMVATVPFANHNTLQLTLGHLAPGRYTLVLEGIAPLVLPLIE